MDEQQLMQQIMEMEKIVKPKLDKEALRRYGTVKVVHPETAINALIYLYQGIAQGKIGSVSDEELKKLLSAMSSKKEIKIRR